MPDITQTCRNTGKEFLITEKDQKFYRRIHVPLPTLCPEERQKRRLAWRNERILYNGKSALTGRPLITMYHPDSPYVVYDQSEWWSNEFDPLQYGKEYDFSRSFLDQFHELQNEVPRMNLINTDSENSEYTNYTSNNKNCYLIFSNSFGNNEDCSYGTCLQSSKDCIDSIHITQCEMCKGCIDCTECFRLVDSQDCVRCSESYFLIDCRNCTYCFGSIGLRNKKYYFCNNQMSQEEYESKIKSLHLNTWTGFKEAQEAAEKFLSTKPRIYSRQYNTENCTGDYIQNSKNCISCFDTSDVEDVSYMQFAVKGEHDSQDCAYLGKGELNYDSLSLVNAYNCLFCSVCWRSVARLQYCDICFNSQDCFGCIGLKRNQYCILNKQYSKEEYEELVQRIVQQMKQDGSYGEFFPIEMSPFAYNETLAQEYFPLTEEEVHAKKLRWEHPQSIPALQTQSIPDAIEDLDPAFDDLLLECEQTKKPFRVIQMELALYRKLGIGIPLLAPDTRREHMMHKRNPRQLWTRNCAQCSIKLETSYAPDKPEIILCDKCYSEYID